MLLVILVDGVRMDFFVDCYGVHIPDLFVDFPDFECKVPPGFSSTSLDCDEDVRS